jgi:glyoxylase-like metal-dependent hydrolase (beta-lactamase superfamily II)
VNTHLHFDHAGNNDLLTKATFFVQPEHYAAAQASNSSFPHQYWNLPHLRYELLDGESTLFSSAGLPLGPAVRQARADGRGQRDGCRAPSVLRQHR